MIVERPNPTQLVLQAAAYHLDGTVKTVLTSANVRVYHVNAGGTEVDDLTSTTMVQVGSTNFWRYKWEPASLAVGQYFVEYTLVDPDGATFVGSEDVAIQDFASQTDLTGIKADVELIRKVETGRWRIDKTLDQMFFYDENGTDVILTFDLKNVDGLPDHVNIFERKPA
jgi:hypothetical protein